MTILKDYKILVIIQIQKVCNLLVLGIHPRGNGYATDRPSGRWEKDGDLWAFNDMGGIQIEVYRLSGGLG
ncbi:MAG: hypothetical protein IPJ74_08510 [Saprospiraceae bacterium]|nr:hypothetical protein [Saprospiraceae bacterium]